MPPKYRIRRSGGRLSLERNAAPDSEPRDSSGRWTSGTGSVEHSRDFPFPAAHEVHEGVAQLASKHAGDRPAYEEAARHVSGILAMHLHNLKPSAGSLAIAKQMGDKAAVKAETAKHAAHKERKAAYDAFNEASGLTVGGKALGWDKVQIPEVGKAARAGNVSAPAVVSAHPKVKAPAPTPSVAPLLKPAKAPAMGVRRNKDGSFSIVRNSLAVAAVSIQRNAIRHAPHNLSIAGKDFKGGQFIPDSDYAKASADEKAKIDGKADVAQPAAAGSGPATPAYAGTPRVGTIPPPLKLTAADKSVLRAALKRQKADGHADRKFEPSSPREASVLNAYAVHKAVDETPASAGHRYVLLNSRDGTLWNLSDADWISSKTKPGMVASGELTPIRAFDSAGSEIPVNAGLVEKLSTPYAGPAAFKAYEARGHRVLTPEQERAEREATYRVPPAWSGLSRVGDRPAPFRPDGEDRAILRAADAREREADAHGRRFEPGNALQAHLLMKREVARAIAEPPDAGERYVFMDRTSGTLASVASNDAAGFFAHNNGYKSEDVVTLRAFGPDGVEIAADAGKVGDLMRKVKAAAPATSNARYRLGRTGSGYSIEHNAIRRSPRHGLVIDGKQYHAGRFLPGGHFARVVEKNDADDHADEDNDDDDRGPASSSSSSSAPDPAAPEPETSPPSKPRYSLIRRGAGFAIARREDRP